MEVKSLKVEYDGKGLDDTFPSVAATFGRTATVDELANLTGIFIRAAHDFGMESRRKNLVAVQPGQSKVFMSFQRLSEKVSPEIQMGVLAKRISGEARELGLA